MLFFLSAWGSAQDPLDTSGVSGTDCNSQVRGDFIQLTVAASVISTAQPTPVLVSTGGAHLRSQSSRTVMYCGTPELLLDQLFTRCQEARAQGSGLAASVTPGI